MYFCICSSDRLSKCGLVGGAEQSRNVPLTMSYISPRLLRRARLSGNPSSFPSSLQMRAICSSSNGYSTCIKPPTKPCKVFSFPLISFSYGSLYGSITKTLIMLLPFCKMYLASYSAVSSPPRR